MDVLHSHFSQTKPMIFSSLNYIPQFYSDNKNDHLKINKNGLKIQGILIGYGRHDLQLLHDCNYHKECEQIPWKLKK